jgi:hypothetical protein
VYPEEFSFDLTAEERKPYINSFIQRVNALETQGRLPYSEVIRVEDFTNGTLNGYTRVSLLLGLVFGFQVMELLLFRSCER